MLCQMSLLFYIQQVAGTKLAINRQGNAGGQAIMGWEHQSRRPNEDLTFKTDDDSRTPSFPVLHT